jgi:uncharacterized repeat protein (TIGR03809 family)
LRLRPFFLLAGWFMTHRIDVARGRDIVARWSALAERRLDYLTELFETGRWRRFHSEAAFLENIQEAKAAVETWRDLLTREASLDNSAIDLSWLGRGRPTLPRDGRARVQPRPLPPASVETPVKLAPDMSVTVEIDQIVSLEAPSAPTMDHGSALTLDLASIQQRYPLLRNAL